MGEIQFLYYKWGMGYEKNKRNYLSCGYGAGSDCM